MTRTLACALSTGLLLAAGVALRATAAQDRTAQPGQPTQGKVWIQNRGDAEAVPVRLQNIADDGPPLRVQVMGTPTVVLGVPSGLVGAARQRWEYRNVTVPSGEDPSAILNKAGDDGWEATGLAVPTQGGSLVVMKRPR